MLSDPRATLFTDEAMLSHFTVEKRKKASMSGKGLQNWRQCMSHIKLYRHSKYSESYYRSLSRNLSADGFVLSCFWRIHTPGSTQAGDLVSDLNLDLCTHTVHCLLSLKVEVPRPEYTRQQDSKLVAETPLLNHGCARL